MNLASFGSMEWIPVMPGIRHKVFDRSGKRLRLVEYTPEMEPHWCQKGHYGYLLEGRFEVEFSDSKQVYERGDGLFLPPGPERKHRARALTDVVRIFFLEELDQ